MACYCCGRDHWAATAEGVIYDRGGALRLLDALRLHVRLQRAARLHTAYRERRRGRRYR